MAPTTVFFGLFGTKKRVKKTAELSGAELSEALLHNLYAKGKVPGMAVSLRQNGQILFEKGYGGVANSSKHPIDPGKTYFRTASISKCITGVALARMVEQGLVQLDDSFYKFVPDYPKKQFDFTLRQLASHTAGIRPYKGKEYALNKSMTIAEGTDLFKKEPLAYIPGSDFIYTSLDFVLLSLAMEKAAGMPFEDYVNNEVLRPLNMLNTRPEARKNSQNKLKKNELVRFYTRSGSGFRKAIPVNNFYKLAGGGYLSTAADIATLGQAILDETFVRPDLMQEFLSPQIILGKSVYYGLGWQASQDMAGRHYYGHVGNSVGAYTNFFVYPHEKLVVSILINSSDPKIQPELDQAIDAAIQAINV